MRCVACNNILTPFESTFKSSTSGEFLDLCTKCYKFIKEDVPVVVNNTLEHEDGTEVANYIDNEEENKLDNYCDDNLNYYNEEEH